MKYYDVIVAGGGAAGVAAAVGAARLGARTLLLERYGFLGGAATNALVLTYCGFYSGGPQPQRTVGGVGWEVLQGLRDLGFSTEPVRSKSGNQIVLLDPEALKLALDRLVLAAGVELNLHTRLVAARREGDAIAEITVADHQGLRELRAGTFVDASGEASLSAYAGVELTLAGGPGSRVQPASFPVRIDGVAMHVVPDRERLAALVSEYNATAAVKIPRADGGVLMRMPFAGEFWWMAVDLDTDGISAPDLSRAETSAREQAWQFLQVLRKLPGFERAHLAASGPQVGIRESRRPRSLRDVTREDALAGRRNPHGIARASWPMEVHVAPGQPRLVPIGGDGFFDVPHGALQAWGTRNLWLAGRVIGADPDAYGSVRVMATAFATGQAAGVSAALQAQGGAAASAEVRRLLAAQGALV